jgi:hypothetical protein
LDRKTPLRSKSTLKAKAPMKRSGSKRKPKTSPNEFPEQTRMTVRARSGGNCEVGTENCTGTATHFHHRKLRRHKDQRPVNALHCCSTCHGVIHANVAKSYLLGWLVQSFMDPAEVKVVRAHVGGR